MDELTPEQVRKKALFDLYPKEKKEEILNSITDQHFQVISSKMGVLPAISAISATMLVVATFNGNLLPLDTEIKVLISILILLVPLSLILYLAIIIRAENAAYNLYESYLGKKAVKGRWSDRFFHSLPVSFAVVILVVMLLIVIKIWC
jgi:hypothetical protein